MELGPWTRSTDGPTYHIPSTFLSPFLAAAGCDQIPPILSPPPRDSILSLDKTGATKEKKESGRGKGTWLLLPFRIDREVRSTLPIFSVPECISILMSFLLLLRLLNWVVWWVGRYWVLIRRRIAWKSWWGLRLEEGCPRLRLAHLRCGACLSRSNPDGNLLLGSVQSEVSGQTR